MWFSTLEPANLAFFNSQVMVMLFTLLDTRIRGYDKSGVCRRLLNLPYHTNLLLPNALSDFTITET